MIDDMHLLTATATIVSGYLRGQHFALAELRRPSVSVAELPALISTVHHALVGLGKPAEPMRPDPAVPINKSIRGSTIVCLECGWEGSMLKRHLAVAHGLTPEAYRKRWELPESYSLTAPGYAEKRRSIAKQIGLGQRRNEEIVA